MRSRIGVVLVLCGLLSVSSGCSLRQVQLWVLFNKKKSISTDQARALADLVNSRRAAGACDPNYSGDCVPTNATTIHCRGEVGSGPSVKGPLTVVGWDHFGLDPDRDKLACVDPVGGFDRFGQELAGISIQGWTFDPNDTGPITVDVYIDGAGTGLEAAQPRPDLAGVYPGAGVDHGFDFIASASDDQPHSYCVFGINEGPGRNTLLGCKSIRVRQPGVKTFPAGDAVGLIEGADRLPNGDLHVRGFAFANEGVIVSLVFGTGYTRLLSQLPVISRPDAAAGFDLGSDRVGFDVVIPAKDAFSAAKSICLRASGLGSATSDLMCRDLNT